MVVRFRITHCFMESAMQASNPTDSPIVNSPIVNSPIISSPISVAGDEPIPDFNDACAAGVPAGVRMFYFKFVAIIFVILGGGMYGLYKLCESMGWFN